MNRVWISALVVLAVVVGVMLNMQQVSFGRPGDRDEERRAVRNAFGSDENGEVSFGGLGQVTMQLENGNKVMMKCKGTGLTNDSGPGRHRPVSVRLRVSGRQFVVTEETHATVSASGVGTMICTFRK